MQKGVLLMAFNSREYVFMAAHLALSIKYNDPDLPIQLVHDENINYLTKEYQDVFDQLTPIAKKDVTVNGKFEPGFAKLNAYRYSIFDRTIYLDVDAFAINSLEPLFEKCTDFYMTEVIDKGGKDEKIGYSVWATNEHIWQVFKLPKKAVLHSVQSSFQYFEKGKKAERLCELFIENFNFPKDKLTHQWGNAMPDELIISGSCAQIGHDPGIDASVVYFGNTNNKKPLSEIIANYTILSLYGNGKGTTLVSSNYLDWYDRMAHKRFRTLGFGPIKKCFQLMKGKHVNR
jgi:hypothetical protein